MEILAGRGARDPGGHRHDVRLLPAAGGDIGLIGTLKLDPGHDATQSLEADFAAEALKPKTLREIRLELAYLPSPYKEEKLSFPVSIGSQ